MKIGLVGCGYVANNYATSILKCSELKIIGVTDIIPERSKAFSDFYGIKRYHSLEDLLQDDQIDIILNCADFDRHYEIIKKSLIAKKHIYTEKPLGLNFKKSS